MQPGGSRCAAAGLANDQANHGLIGSRDDYRNQRRGRRHLENRIGPTDRRSGALVRDVGIAESGRTLVALRQWPSKACPKPKRWLMTTAKRRAIDLLRETRLLNGTGGDDRRLRAKEAEAPINLDARLTATSTMICCGWCSPPVTRFFHRGAVALTLRLLCGLTTDEIARHF